MRVLVGCEFSGIVRDAFIARGHDAMSCDLLPTEAPGPHYQGDIFDVINDGWDLAIFHPPCTRLTVAGARWFKGREKEQQEAIEFCERLYNADIPRIALENPIGVLSTKSSLGKPTQIIQPWQFGHEAFKATCIWSKGLPLLRATTPTVVPPKPGTPEHKAWSKVHREPPGPNRWKNRSRTYTGIAAAMAAQWEI